MDSQWIADQLLELTRKVADTAGAVEVLNIRADNLEDQLDTRDTTERAAKDTRDERRFHFVSAAVGAIISALISAAFQLLHLGQQPPSHH